MPVRFRGTIFPQNEPYRTAGTVTRYAVRNQDNLLKNIENEKRSRGTPRLKGGAVPYRPLSKGGVGGFL